MKTKKTLNSDGFTIVELLVSIALGAILVTAFSNVVTSYVHVAQRGRHLNYTNAYAEARIETVRNNGYNALPLGTTTLSDLPSKLPKPKTVTMVVTNPTPGIKQVDLSVQYREQGVQRTHNYRTYVGELGVGQ